MPCVVLTPVISLQQIAFCLPSFRLYFKPYASMVSTHKPMRAGWHRPLWVATTVYETANCSGERHPFDWYNAYFEIEFKITKMDGTYYGGNDEASIINGGHSMINRLEVEFNGVGVFGTPAVNHGINVKNLLEFQSPTVIL